MRVYNSTRFAALAVLVGALACAGNRPETDTETDTGEDQAAAAQDTTSDTTATGYRGMERDTTGQAQRQPSDTFLDNQGVGTPQDTSGYAGMERVEPAQGDTSAQADTTAGARDTTGAWGADSANQGAMDTTSMRSGDTTGYQPSQQPAQDTASAR
jgi:hypothetical protein